MGLMEAYDDVTTWFGGRIALLQGANQSDINNFTREQDAATNSVSDVIGSNAGYAGGFVEGSFEGTGRAYDAGVSESVQNSVDSIENGFSAIGDGIKNGLNYFNPNPLENPLTAGPLKMGLLIGGGLLIFFAMKKGWLK